MVSQAGSFSRGAGAAPLPEREVSSQTPFSFRFVPPQAAQNENQQSRRHKISVAKITVKNGLLAYFDHGK